VLVDFGGGMIRCLFLIMLEITEQTGKEVILTRLLDMKF
jgi:hypothetical protein